MSNDFIEPALSLTREGIHITSADVAQALENKKLSASLITDLEGCHAKWVAKTFVLPNLIEQEPDNAARRGSLFHKIMEDFFSLEPHERSKNVLNEIANTVLSSDEFKDMLTYPEAIIWLKQAVRNYYEMGAQPQKVNIASIPQVSKKGVKYNKKGLEIFVKGNIGDTKRDILGYIDRLVVDPKKLGNAVIVEDWKGLALDTKLPTPDGWTTMGDVAVGDKVLGTYGVPVSVVAKSQIHNRVCYEISFSHGESVIADNEHLWQVRLSNSSQPVTLSTDELYESYSSLRDGFISIDLPKPLKFSKQQLSSEPYDMGRETAEQVCSSIYDKQHVELPVSYLRSSINQRLALLAGFMDVGGYYVAGEDHVCFRSYSSEVNHIVAELLASLGIGSWRKHDSLNNGCEDVAFYLTLNPFRDSEFAAQVESFFNNASTVVHGLHSIVITGIKKVDSVPTQCIKVDAENSLYLCGSLFTPTHNTGAKVKRWKASTKSNDGLGETRQQHIYTMLLEQQGLNVSGARLIYPVAMEIVDVDLEDEAFKKRVVEDIQQADKTIDDLIETNEFEFTPAFLCSWCPLVNICPAADLKPFDKAVKARQQQPDADVLQRAIEIK